MGERKGNLCLFNDISLWVFCSEDYAKTNADKLSNQPCKLMEHGLTIELGAYGISAVDMEEVILDLKQEKKTDIEHNKVSTLLSEIHMNLHSTLYFCYNATFHIIFPS